MIRNIEAEAHAIIERMPDAREILLDLARNDAMVAAAVSCWKSGNMPSWEHAMTTLVVHLARDRKRLLDLLMLVEMNRPISETVIGVSRRESR